MNRPSKLATGLLALVSAVLPIHYASQAPVFADTPKPDTTTQPATQPDVLNNPHFKAWLQYIKPAKRLSPAEIERREALATEAIRNSKKLQREELPSAQDLNPSTYTSAIASRILSENVHLFERSLVLRNYIAHAQRRLPPQDQETFEIALGDLEKLKLNSRFDQNVSEQFGTPRVTSLQIAAIYFQAKANLEKEPLSDQLILGIYYSDTNSSGNLHAWISSGKEIIDPSRHIPDTKARTYALQEGYIPLTQLKMERNADPKTIKPKNHKKVILRDNTQITYTPEFICLP